MKSKNKLKKSKNLEQTKDSDNSDGLTCQLTIPRGYHFLYLPYALVVRKGASKDLIPYLNQRYSTLISFGC